MTLRAVQFMVCVALAAHGVSCAANPVAGPTGHTLVQVSFTGLSPETVQIPSDGNITWVNGSADSSAIVVLPASMGASFTCAELGPVFRQTAEGYESLPILSQWSPQTERVELPCALRPGRYDYSVRIQNSGLAQTEAAGPGRTLSGVIVVE